MFHFVRNGFGINAMLLAVHADEVFELVINATILPDGLSVLVAPRDPDVVAVGTRIIVGVTTSRITICHLEDVD